MGPLSGPLGSHESLPVLWLDGVCNQIRRLSHRVEADESRNLVCYGLDRVVKRKLRLPRCMMPEYVAEEGDCMQSSVHRLPVAQGRLKFFLLFY